MGYKQAQHYPDLDYTMELRLQDFMPSPEKPFQIGKTGRGIPKGTRKFQDTSIVFKTTRDNIIVCLGGVHLDGDELWELKKGHVLQVFCDDGGYDLIPLDISIVEIEGLTYMLCKGADIEIVHWEWYYKNSHSQKRMREYKI